MMNKADRVKQQLHNKMEFANVKVVGLGNCSYSTDIPATTN